MKPYSEYDKVNASWIEKVPRHWEKRKLRSILQVVSERNRADLPLLSVVREKGVIKRDLSSKEENHNYIPDDLSNYKVVKVDQFAMNKMKAWQGSYGVSKYNGIVSPAYFVFNLNSVSGIFFHKALRSKAYIPFFTKASDGVRVGQWDLNKDRMEEIPFFIPPLEEQTQIARFLDYKTWQINRFIKAKKKMIELLKEQKQVIINDAVSGKIDVTTGKPYPKYKDSGVEWLGDVPVGWALKRFKYLTRIESGQVDPRVNPYSEMILIAPNHIQSGTAQILYTESAHDQNAISGKYLVSKGQIIYSKIRPKLQKACIAEFECLCSADMYPIAVNNELIPHFLLFLILSNPFTRYVVDLSLRVKMPKVNRDELGNFIISYPDRIIQKRICDYIQIQTKSIDQTIKKILEEISLILEYRDRLIADVVTGQVDVRKIKVPDVPADEDVVIDDITADEEMDEVTEEADI
mgnify:FL=1